MERFSSNRGSHANTTLIRDGLQWKLPDAIHPMRSTRCDRPDAIDPMRSTRCDRPDAIDPMRSTRCDRLHKVIDCDYREVVVTMASQSSAFFGLSEDKFVADDGSAGGDPNDTSPPPATLATEPVCRSPPIRGLNHRTANSPLASERSSLDFPPRGR